MPDTKPETYDPFNCPKCGSHDYGLFAASCLGCPHCLKADLAAALAAKEAAERERDGLIAGRKCLQATADGVYCDEARIARSDLALVRGDCKRFMDHNVELQACITRYGDAGAVAALREANARAEAAERELAALRAEREALDTVLLTIMEECGIKDVSYGDLPGELKERLARLPSGEGR